MQKYKKKIIFIVYIFCVLNSSIKSQNKKIKIFDLKNKVEIKVRKDENTSCHGSYQTNSLFIDNENYFYIKGNEKKTNLFLFYKEKEYQVTNFKDINLFKDVNTFGLSPVLAQDVKKLFFNYKNKIFSIDYRNINKLEYKKEFSINKKFKFWAPLHVTKNGAFLSFTLSKNKETYLARLDVINKKMKIRKSPFLETDNPIANHVYINPLNSNLVLFAHEGSWVTDRVWVWDVKNDTICNVWESDKYAIVGHEFWDPYGNDIYFVQYGSPTRNIPSGVLKFDFKKGIEIIFLTNQYYFSHASISNDKNYLVLDTYRDDDNGHKSVFVYDIKKISLYEIDNVVISAYPAHPHPYFNQNGTKIMYNNYNKLKNTIELKEVNINLIKENNE